MDTLLTDLRFAFRTLRRTPAFTFAAIVCLALGIGANTAIFSVIDAVLLRPLPYREPERLVGVWERNHDGTSDRNSISPANYRDWLAQSHSLSSAAAFFETAVTLTGLGQPEQLLALISTGNLFSTLGVTPMLGRPFSKEEDAPGAARVVILSHGFWQRAYGSDPLVVGKTLMLNGENYAIVGVTPRGFALPGSTASLYLPIRLDPTRDYRVSAGRWLRAIGRLAPNATVAGAQNELSAVAHRLEQTYPIFNAGWGVNIVPLTEQVVGSVRRALLVLVGVVGFVLLIACANVANLQLARAAARQREMVVRSALGAARSRVIRQLLTESVLLSFAGGTLGLLLAYWGTSAIGSLADSTLPRVHEIHIDAAAMAFTLALALATGVIFGLVPALQTTRADLQDVLKEGGRGTTRAGSRRARNALVISQVALSMILLAGAGLMIRSMLRLQAEDPGFDPSKVMTGGITLNGRSYQDDAKAAQFFNSLLERVRATPGVRSAGAIDFLPFNGLGSATDYFVEGRPIPRPEDHLVADIRRVDDGFFRTLTVAVKRGEVFQTRHAAQTQKVVVINEALAKEVFPNQDPIGQHVLMPWGDTLRGEVIGVVANIRSQGLDSLAKPTLYWLAPQWPTSFMTLVVRASGNPSAIIPSLRAAVASIDPNIPLANLKPLDDYLAQSVSQRRFSMMLLAGFASIALILAAIGIYGVLAYAVAQRTREIGVRMALGARQADVLRLVVRQGLSVAMVGLAIGVVGALALTRVMRTMLYETSATDPITFVGVAVTLGAVASLASWLPARRASRVDPVVALREE